MIINHATVTSFLSVYTIAGDPLRQPSAPSVGLSSSLEPATANPLFFLQLGNPQAEQQPVLPSLLHLHITIFPTPWPLHLFLLPLCSPPPHSLTSPQPCLSKGAVPSPMPGASSSSLFSGESHRTYDHPHSHKIPIIITRVAAATRIPVGRALLPCVSRYFSLSLPPSLYIYVCVCLCLVYGCVCV